MDACRTGYQTAKVADYPPPIKFEDLSQKEKPVYLDRLQKMYDKEKKRLGMRRLSRDQKLQIQTSLLREFAEKNRKIKIVAEKALPPTKEVVKAAEKAVVEQAKNNQSPQIEKDKGKEKIEIEAKKNNKKPANIEKEKIESEAKKNNKKPGKHWIPKKPLPEQPDETTTSSAAKVAQDEPLKAQFQTVTNKFQAKMYMTGTEKNEFAPMLKEWKKMISALGDKIIAAQSMKNKLAEFWKILDKHDQYDDEFTRIFNPMWDMQVNLKQFVQENEKSWTTMIEKLKATRKNSVPKPIPKESQKAFQTLSKPTSSETDQDTEKMRKVVKETNEIIEARRTNYQLSLWCSTQLQAHMDKLKHRISEIDGYLNSQSMKKYKATPHAPSEHMLRKNNKQGVIDEVLNTLENVLSAKEHMDLIIEGLGHIGSSYKKDYQQTLLDYDVIFKSEVANLQRETKQALETIARTKKELDKVIHEENIDDFPSVTLDHLREIHKHNPERLKEFESRPKILHTRKKAATTQKRILVALEKNIHDRMKKDTYCSWGVLPLYSHYSMILSSLKS